MQTRKETRELTKLAQAIFAGKRIEPPELQQLIYQMFAEIEDVTVDEYLDAPTFMRRQRENEERFGTAVMQARAVRVFSAYRGRVLPYLSNWSAWTEQ